MEDYRRRLHEAIENIQFLTLETINRNIRDLLNSKELYYAALEVTTSKDVIESLRTIDLIIEEPSSFLSPVKMKIYVWDDEYLRELLSWRVKKEADEIIDFDIE